MRLTQLAQLTGIPVRTLRYAAASGRLAAETVVTPQGVYYLATVDAVHDWKRARKMGRPRKHA